MEFDEDDFSCIVCTLMYSEKEKSPLMLHCGHTLCKECVLAIMKTNNLCGECRSPILTRDVNAFPINYALLRVMETLKKGQKPHMRECIVFKDKIGKLLRKLKESEKLYMDRKNDLLTKIDKWYAYGESLKVLKATVEYSHQDLKESEKYKNKIEQLLQNVSCKSDYFKARINALNLKMDRVKSFKKDRENKLTQVQNSIVELKKCKSLHELSKIVQETKDLLGHGDLDNKFILDIQFDLAEEDFTPVMTSPKDYCIKHKENCFSSLHVHGEKIFMKSAQNSKSVTGASKCIDISGIEPYTAGAYLCVESNGMKATLEFELYNRSDSQEFALLCSGVKGKCLTNSSFFCHERVGLEGENISAGFATYSAKKKVKYSTSTYIKSGHLVGSDDGTSVFKIYLEDWPPQNTNNCLGKLLIGQSFLKNCIRNGYPVKIDESGLIFDFKKKVQFEIKGFMTSY